jgi:opacity protein-like surface antigen
MRKLILVMAVILISITTIQVQGQTAFGIKAGATSANLKFSGNGVNISADSKIGFYGGLFVQIGVSENFAVQPELLYSLLGSKSSDQGDDEKLNLSYVSVPVLAKYIKDGFSIVLGPQVSFLVSAKDKASDGTTDIKDEFKSTEIAGVIGAGYTLANGLGFDARYQLGLSNIGKGEDLEGAKIKSNAFMVGLHYRFHKK